MKLGFGYQIPLEIRLGRDTKFPRFPRKLGLGLKLGSIRISMPVFGMLIILWYTGIPELQKNCVRMWSSAFVKPLEIELGVGPT